MKSYKHLVKYSLAKGHLISVFDGEIWEVKRSTSYKDIIDCIESVEEAQINIRDKDDNKMGWAHIIPFGLADDETVSDYTCTEYMEAWDVFYDKSPNAIALAD